MLQPSTIDVDRRADGYLSKRYLTNYPFGLPAGSHTLVGVWNKDGQAAWATQTVAVAFTSS